MAKAAKNLDNSTREYSNKPAPSWYVDIFILMVTRIYFYLDTAYIK
jgi:hypothetical protein